MPDKTELLESSILREFDKSEIPPQGSIVRRIGKEKDQQGMFTRCDDKGGLILVNVVNPLMGEYLAEAGVLYVEKGDQLFRYMNSFADSPRTADALEYLYAWPLYQKNSELQKPIEQFIRTAYTPEQILLFRKNDSLSKLFIPVQQKFSIGKFAVKTDPVKLRKDRFRDRLQSMQTGDHLTYLALIPQIKSYSPAFYSAGTKPHYETDICLQSEPFAFPPSHGGHIRLIKGKNDKKCFIVDAGSQYKGKGGKTLLSTAQEVVRQLKRVYPEFEYVPIEGRGAFGSQQSY
jgi:hypothetical protein